MKIKFKFENEVKKNEYSSKYFLMTQKIVKHNKNSKDVTMKFFHFEKEAMVCGIEEVIQLLKFAINKTDYNKLRIYGKQDGDIVKKYEPVLVIRGDYNSFGHLENLIDSILTRRSSIATNAWEVCKIVDSNRLIFMADRSDDYLLQKYDGYAAYCGGFKNFVTKQHIKYIKNEADVKYVGTIPHALIQQFDGDLVTAIKAFQKRFKNQSVTALIDYHNDCLNEIAKISVANLKVDSVRIDTSKRLIDKSLQSLAKNKKGLNLYGVNETLIKKVREKLDQENMSETKIIISSNITNEIIKKYEKKQTPIDIYGVGKAITRLSIHFTGDLIKINEKYEAKKGRKQNIEKEIESLRVYNDGTI